MDDEDREAADRTLLRACKKLTPQVWYNQKVTAASHFWAKRGMRVKKEDIVGRTPNLDYAMTLEEYMSVSKMSMRLYIAAKLPLHYLFLNCIFRLCPTGPTAKKTHGMRWLRGGSGETPSSTPSASGTRQTEAPREHTVREAATSSDSRKSWYIYTWNDVHLFLPHVSTWYE